MKRITFINKKCSRLAWSWIFPVLMLLRFPIKCQENRQNYRDSPDSNLGRAATLRGNDLIYGSASLGKMELSRGAFKKPETVRALAPAPACEKEGAESPRESRRTGHWGRVRGYFQMTSAKIFGFFHPLSPNHATFLPLGCFRVMPLYSQGGCRTSIGPKEGSLAVAVRVKSELRSCAWLQGHLESQRRMLTTLSNRFCEQMGPPLPLVIIVTVVAGASAEGDQVPSAAIAAAEGDSGAAQGQEHHQVRQGEDRGRSRADEQSESVTVRVFVWHATWWRVENIYRQAHQVREELSLCMMVLFKINCSFQLAALHVCQEMHQQVFANLMGQSVSDMIQCDAEGRMRYLHIQMVAVFIPRSNCCFG